MNDHPKRAETWVVSLEPIRGSEIDKTRPALIISNDKNNKYSSTVTVIPITSFTTKVYPFEVMVYKENSGLSFNSKIKCNQIRTVDKSRLVKKIGQILPDAMKKVEEALHIHLEI
ncbi:MAG: type II toxin-antitoxin system PemK/MazF family toxin [Actinomycetota bacterium]